ncbi:hypothetical protein [Phytoactinopolyspora mesophila]|uniref:DDE-type integrase/transposase/recombinase n=1 Tax=Phytoactinopolyspora mesophila TaxID=2650750 RepID=A0A7K3M889_9ACTN|nr:hypothetical protein [Phytoactinopolyspora mesophila]NDL59526.1 hypothetical protein [Phytoactinopolyspora mesophila]
MLATGVEPGTLVCHSDAGSRYTSLRYTELLALEGIAPSIGTIGVAYDNGRPHGVDHRPVQNEAIAIDVFQDCPLTTLVDVEYTTAGYVDRWNHRRLHSTIGQILPTEHEQAYLRCPQPGTTPV